MLENSLGGQPLVTREQGEEILRPYFDTLNQCIDEAWEAWKSDYAAKHHILDARARAAIVFCEIAHRAQRAFAEFSDATIVRKRNTITIFIGENITLRFKKIRKSGRCSNIITLRQAKFLSQMQLPGILDGTLVHAGYQLDDLQQEIIRKAVVCQLQKRVLWQLEITGEAELPILMPTPNTPQVPSTEPRFVPKVQNQEKPAEAEGGSA